MQARARLTLGLLLILGCLGASSPATRPAAWLDVSKIYGKIQFVSAFADYKVEVVDAFPDLRVQKVSAFADSAGKWEIVSAFPDFKIEVVQAFADFKIQYVNAFPGPR